MSKPVMIDAGACIGEVTEKYAKTHVVYAFEPNPLNFEFLQKKFDGVPDVHIIPYALGASHLSTILYDQERRVGVNSSTTIATSARAAGGQGHTVGQMKLSNFLDDFHIGYVDILKLDIEGSEYDVLQDLMDRAKLVTIGTIYVEFHGPQLIPDLQATHDRVYAELLAKYQGILHVWDWPAHKYVRVK